MKATLAFTLPEEMAEYLAAVKGSHAISALEDILSDIFRPARKHGYDDEAIQKLVTKLGDDGTELINLLEQKFHQILSAAQLDHLV